jgi:calcineurin-like phosphoesterase
MGGTSALPRCEEHAVDCVIANSENVANGAGITSGLALRLLAGGADIHKMSNHVREHKQVYISGNG